MSDDDRETLTELHNLVGGGKKRQGCCCSTHPICCTCALGTVAALCLLVVVLGAVFQDRVDREVQQVIAEVWLASLGWAPWS